MRQVKADAATRRASEEQLADLGARAEINGSTGEWSSAGILAAGRHGLEYFRLFDPHHARLTGRRHDFRGDFLRRYDSGSDLVFGSLREDRERFDTVATGLSDNVVALRNAGAGAFESWRGDGAEATKAHLDGLLTRVDTIRGRFTGLAETLGETADALDRAIYDKAVATSKLYADRVDDKSSDDVRFLVDFRRRARKDDVDNDELTDAAALCGLPPGPSAWRNRHTHVKAVATAVETWLFGVFAPAHEAKLATFDEICATAREKLAAGWQALDAALDAGATESAPAPAPAPASRQIAWPTAEPASTGESAGGSAGGTYGTSGSGAVVSPGEHLSPGVTYGAAPVTGDEEAARRPAPAQAGNAAAATGMPGGGMLGGVPGAGGQGGEDQQRRTLDLPLTGIAFADADPAAAVLGDEQDPATYNEAEEQDAIARDEIRRAEAEAPAATDGDDLW